MACYLISHLLSLISQVFVVHQSSAVTDQSGVGRAVCH